MDSIFQLTLLFDFYSELLTEKQKLFFELYHFEDMSLNEIGNEQGISPQAVRDLIKRTEKNLFGYESKLKLIEKHLQRVNRIETICVLMDEIVNQKQILDRETSDKIKGVLFEIKE